MASYKLSIAATILAAFVCAVNGAPAEVAVTVVPTNASVTHANKSEMVNLSADPTVVINSTDLPSIGDIVTILPSTTTRPLKYFVNKFPDWVNVLQSEHLTTLDPAPSSAYQLLPSVLGALFTAFISLRSIMFVAH